MTAHPSILAWKIPWTEEPGRLQSRELQRSGPYWATEHLLFQELSEIRRYFCPVRCHSQGLWCPQTCVSFICHSFSTHRRQLRGTEMVGAFPMSLMLISGLFLFIFLVLPTNPWNAYCCSSYITDEELNLWKVKPRARVIKGRSKRKQEWCSITVCWKEENWVMHLYPVLPHWWIYLLLAFAQTF